MTGPDAKTVRDPRPTNPLCTSWSAEEKARVHVLQQLCRDTGNTTSVSQAQEDVRGGTRAEGTESFSLRERNAKTQGQDSDQYPSGILV